MPLTYLENHAKREMLKFHVGHVIFCPGCRTIMDCRRAVSIDFKYTDTGKLAMTRVLCAECFDEKAESLKAWAEAVGLSMEVTDGRLIFANAAKTGETITCPNAIKTKDVKVNDRFEIYHSSGWTTVKVVAITGHRHLNTRSGVTPPRTTRFVCINEKTGREIVVKSAAKFRSRVA